MFAADAVHGPRSREALRRCLAEGTLVACEVVWAEVAAGFASATAAREQLDDLDVRFSAVLEPAALGAGDAFRTYVQRGGSRERVVADFLIGAHADVQAERLLTRDRGFHRTYFQKLTIVDPSEDPPSGRAAAEPARGDQPENAEQAEAAEGDEDDLAGG